jgi:hypothetical protein
MAKRKRKKSKQATPQYHFDRDVPTYDFFKYIDLDNPGDLDEAIRSLIYDLESDYFLQWEAVMCQEQSLPLTKKQKKALSNLISFGDESDDRILYINEIPRPSEPWYEIVRKIAPCLLQEPFKTDALYYGATLEGWPDLVEALEAYARDLSLPEGIKGSLDIIPLDLRHRLWLQRCFDALHGLGQAEDLSLANEGQQHRVAWFADLLREHKDTVQYFDLTLEKLLARVILPPKEEKIFVEMIMLELGLTSVQERLVDFL